MPNVDPAIVALLAVVAIVIALVATAVSVALVKRVMGLRRRLVTAFPEGSRDVLDLVAHHTEALRAIQEDQQTVHHNAEKLRERLDEVLSRVGVVRFDAFDDVGGAQSFSTALLDRNANGIVITAINGRQETRCYAKQVTGGESEFTLSTEERTAIEVAMDGRGRTPILDTRRGRRRVS